MWGVMLHYFKYDSYIYTTKMQIIGNNEPLQQLGIDLFRWSIGFIGSGMVLVAATCISKSLILQAIGKALLGIYLLNNYVNIYVLKYATTDFSINIFVSLVEIVLVLSICYAGNWVLSRNKLIRRILFRGR